MAGGKDSIKLIANNKKAYFDYFVEQEIECGIVLTGTEIKSIRKGSANLKDTYARIKKRKLNNLISSLKEGDILITTEISRLGRSLFEVMGILQYCLEKIVRYGR